MRKFPTLARLLSAAALLALPLAGHAQFTAGRLVVAQATTNASPSTVSLVEYSTAGTASGYSVALPTAASGTNRQFRVVGSSTTEGGLSLTADGKYLTIAGYDAPTAPSPALPSTPTNYNRVVARVAADGTVNTATAISDAFSGGNVRSVVSNDGTQFWLSGSTDGVRYVGTLGTGTATTSTLVSTTITNSRQLHIANGQLYQSTASGSTRGTYQVGTGLPTTTGNVATSLLSVGATASPNATAFVDIDADGNPDVAYLVDGTTTVGSTGGIYKFSRTGATWTARGSVLNVAGFLYVAGRTNGSNVELFITTPTNIYSFTEPTSNATSNISGTLSAALATTASTSPFRGIAFAPTSTTPANTALTITNGTFTSTAAGSSSSSSNFTLSNSGATPQTVTLTTSGAPFSYSGGTVTVPAAVGATPGTATFTVTFAPTAAGTFSGTVTAAVTGFQNVTSSSFSAPSTAPANTNLTITTGTFSSTASGSTSTSTGFLLNNAGASSQSVTLSTSGAPFSLTTTTYTVPAGGSVPVTVTFSPTAAGTFNGTLTAVVSGFQDVVSGSFSATSTAPAPTATNYSATSLLAGIQSNEVVTGTNLTGATVSVTGSTAGTVVVGTPTVTATTITVTLLAPSAGSFTLNVTTPGGTLTQPITVTTPPTGFFEPFETASRSANYATPNPLALTTGQWNLTEALLGNQAPTATPGSGEKKNNGQSVRFRTMGVAEMAFDKGNGAGTISFVAALYGNDAVQATPASSILVEISTNGGTNYTTVGTTPTLTSTLTTYSFTPNVGGNIRLRFTSNTITGNTTPRINLDDLLVTDFASVVGDLTVSATGQNISGTYNNVTITSTGSATVTGPLTVNTAMTVQSSGSLTTGSQTIGGAGTFTLASGATLNISNTAGIASSGATGPVQVTGTRSFSPDASYVYNGTAPQATGSGLPATVRSLTVNNTASLVANRTVTLTNPLSVSQLVRLTSGSLNVGTTGFTLLSTPGQGTALVYNEGTGTVVGTGTMQRAIDILTSDNIGYHHFSSPVSNTTINDLAAANFVFGSDFVLNPAYNTATLATQTRPFPTVYGYDERRITPGNGLSGTAASSVATDLGDFDKGFFSPTSGDAMTVGKGYTANVPNAAVIDFVGTFNNGAQTLGSLTRGAGVLTDDKGWHLLGNPYPAPLDWSTVTTAQLTGVSTSIYQYHAASRYTGSYTVYQTTGTGVANSGVGTGSPLVDAGAGFFARVSTPSSTGSIALTNTNRVTIFGAQPAFGRQTSTPRPELHLQVAGANLTDEAFLVLDAQATAGVEAQYDAAKLYNTTGLNLATLVGAEQLAIDTRPLPATATVVPLFVGVPAAGVYTFTVAKLANFGTAAVYLRDALTGIRTLLTAGTSYRFAMTGYNATGRFTLELAPAGALATAAQTLAAQVQVYPNPAHGQFAVTLPVLKAGAAVSASLTNALGQVVRTQNVSAIPGQTTTATVDVHGLVAGIYTLRLRVDGTAVTRKIVVE